MSDLLRPLADTSDLVTAYQSPYHPPVDARLLVEALGHSALVNVWPFCDDPKGRSVKDAA
jgi:hypothetical protein